MHILRLIINSFIHSTHNRLDQVISQIAFSPFMLRFNANDAISPKWNIHQASPCLPRGGIDCFWSVKINDMCASLRVHGNVSTNRPWPLLPLVNISNICWLILSLHHRIKVSLIGYFFICVSVWASYVTFKRSVTGNPASHNRLWKEFTTPTQFCGQDYSTGLLSESLSRQ